MAFLGALFEQLGTTLERQPVPEMRMDGAFFHAGVIDLLDAEGALYAIKLPFWRWLGLKKLIARRRRRRWERVEETVQCFDLWLWVPTWSCVMRVVAYRKRVRHRTAKNYQLDLFDPDDVYFKYSAIVNNRQGGDRAHAMVLHVRARHPREGLR